MLHLDLAADDGVQLVPVRGLRRIVAELLEGRGVGALGATRAIHVRADRLTALVVATLVATEHLDGGLMHLRQARASLGQDLGGRTLALLEETK